MTRYTPALYQAIPGLAAAVLRHRPRRVSEEQAARLGAIQRREEFRRQVREQGALLATPRTQEGTR